MASWVDVSRLPASEREGLVSVLDAQRVGLIRKIEDLSDAPAREAPTVSSLSLLGLLKHAATWECRWFHVIMAGEASPDGWPEALPEDHDSDLVVDSRDTVADLLAEYRAQIAKSNAIVASRQLDDVCARSDIVECNLRYVLLHMIEETARHAGHADIIRESLDGARGI